jgi:hypothetical protein
VSEGIQSFMIGAHAFRFEPPDALFMTLGEVMSLEDVRAFKERIHTLAPPGRALRVICDMAALRAITADARHALIRVERAYPYRAMALVGADFSMRVLGKAMTTAARLFAPQLYTFPIEFFPSLAEARAWIEAMPD